MLDPRSLSTLLACALACATAVSQVTEDTPGWFGFTIPGLDSSTTATDLSWLSPEPAGTQGHLRVSEGHFVDARGQRVRLFGTNLTATSCFPDKSVSPRLAAHFRKLGFNVVRFHFMDTGTAPRGIFSPGAKALDPDQLDKLDYLIAQLKQHGIYSNLNLHVAHGYGVPRELVLQQRTFRMGKVLDNFYPPFLAFRKEYARALLTHRNRYTGNRYGQEPAICAVELNNENSLLRAPWDVLRSMPDPFGRELRGQWNTWLRERYRSTDALRQSWARGEELLAGEVLTEGSWVAQSSGGAEAALETDATLGDGAKGLRYVATKPGAAGWHLQFYRRGLTLEDAAAYTLSFRARGSGAERLHVSVMLDTAPWGSCGLTHSVRLTPEFAQVRLTFRAQRTQPGKVRLNFSTLNQPGTIELAEVSLRRGGILGLPAGESLEQQTVSVPARGRTAQTETDFGRFLVETERRNVAELVRYLKEDLAVRAPISNTQASYGGALGVHREATLCDFVDMHGYWQHPHFPGKPWDGGNWRIGNTSQASAADGGTLAGVAAHRVAGLPFTVSEYNIPAPNDQAAELFPMLAAIAAYQDWDGIYQYTYSNFTPDWDASHIKSYFDLCGHTGQLAGAPLAALMFRLGLVKPAKAAFSLQLPKDVSELGWEDMRQAWRRQFGLSGAIVSMRKLEVALVDGLELPTFNFLMPDGERVSDTGQIRWDPAKATFTVHAPAVRVALGPIQNVTLGNVEIASDGRYVCIGVVALDGKPLAESRNALVSVVARVENQNMGWDAGRKTVGRDWGRGPTVCEGVTATLWLPGSDWTAERLDGAGAATGPARGQAAGQRFELRVSPEDRTLWFLLRR